MKINVKLVDILYWKMFKKNTTIVREIFVSKVSHIKFSCQKPFVPATPYRSKYFMHLIFVHNRAYENVFDDKIFPNYGI